jgi:CDP-ribitol ribitolphosphotransferase
MKLALRIVYAPMKLLPAKNKIVYLSRQSNKKSLDMELLEKAIAAENPNIKQIFRLRTLEGGLLRKLTYSLGIIGDMYYLATSRVAIVDTYSITVSCLSHKKTLKVIQMWHALGALKKFGLQSIGTKEGRDAKISRAMRMHMNYDYVLAPSRATGVFYQEAFGAPEDKIRIYPLPRVDEICSSDNRAAEFYRLNPGMGDKKIVLYVPTFRARETYITEMLKTEFFDKEDYQLIISAHPLFSMGKRDERFIQNGKFSSLELMKIADIIITDYSACAFEAALLLKPLYFFVPDLDEYSVERGINIDIKKELPEAVFEEPDELMQSIEEKPYDLHSLYMFKSKYVETASEGAAKSLAKFVISNLEGE